MEIWAAVDLDGPFPPPPPFFALEPSPGGPLVQCVSGDAPGARPILRWRPWSLRGVFPESALSVVTHTARQWADLILRHRMGEGMGKSVSVPGPGCRRSRASWR